MSGGGERHGQRQRSRHARGQKGRPQKLKPVRRFELRLPDSESGVITTTLYRPGTGCPRDSEVRRPVGIDLLNITL